MKVLLPHKSIRVKLQTLLPQEEVEVHKRMTLQSTVLPPDQKIMILESSWPFLPQKESLAQLAQERWEKEEA